MKTMRKFGLMFTMALLLGACHGAKYHYKSGKKYAQASMLKESVTSYKRAIDRKPNKETTARRSTNSLMLRNGVTIWFPT